MRTRKNSGQRTFRTNIMPTAVLRLKRNSVGLCTDSNTSLTPCWQIRTIFRLRQNFEDPRRARECEHALLRGRESSMQSSKCGETAPTKTCPVSRGIALGARRGGCTRPVLDGTTWGTRAAPAGSTRARASKPMAARAAASAVRPGVGPQMSTVDPWANGCRRIPGRRRR